MLVAGPSHLQHAVYNNYLSSGSNLNVRPQNSSSVITVSSTSSASSASSVSSGDTNKYNLLKSVKDSIKNGTEIIKNTFLSKISSTMSGSTTVATSAIASTSKIVRKVDLVMEQEILDKSDTSSDEDVDSLKSELIHFKPIVPVPKTPNSHSKPKILRVPSIRPKSEASNPEIFSPCTSPFIPIDPKSPRKSAFSIVTVQEESPQEESPVEQKSEESPGETKVKGKRGRKRKSEVIEKCDNKKAAVEKIKSPNSKKSKQEQKVKEKVEVVQNVRVTRNRKSGESLKRLSQEALDFEFAKKLDEKLNNHNKRGKQATLNNSGSKSKVVPTRSSYNTRSRRN